MSGHGLRLIAALGALTFASACRSAGHLPVSREFVPTADAFGEPAEVAAVLAESGAPPWTVLVGGADQLDTLLAARGAHPTATVIIDLSVVAPLQRDAVRARALEAALEGDGALLLDESGENARALRGTSRDVSLVSLDARHNITAVVAPAGAAAGEGR